MTADVLICCKSIFSCFQKLDGVLDKYQSFWFPLDVKPAICGSLFLDLGIGLLEMKQLAQDLRGQVKTCDDKSDDEIMRHSDNEDQV